jgi:hypothetical protein
MSLLDRNDSLIFDDENHYVLKMQVIDSILMVKAWLHGAIFDEVGLEGYFFEKSNLTFVGRSRYL